MIWYCQKLYFPQFFFFFSFLLFFSSFLLYFLFFIFYFSFLFLIFYFSFFIFHLLSFIFHFYICFLFTYSFFIFIPIFIFIFIPILVLFYVLDKEIRVTKRVPYQSGRDRFLTSKKYTEAEFFIFEAQSYVHSPKKRLKLKCAAIFFYSPLNFFSHKKC